DHPGHGFRRRADRHRHSPRGRDRHRADHQYGDRAPGARCRAGRRRRGQGAAQMLRGGTGRLCRDHGSRMSVIVNEVRRSTYLDSIVLMRISRQLAALAGVEEAGLVIGTPANKDILQEARILGPDGDKAGPGDLIVALRAKDDHTAAAALAEAKRLLEHPEIAGAPSSEAASRTIRAAFQRLPNANVALISVPGHFAPSEARTALAAGLNVMIFSDNVAIEEEVALKREARERGLMM